MNQVLHEHASNPTCFRPGILIGLAAMGLVSALPAYAEGWFHFDRAQYTAEIRLDAYDRSGEQSDDERGYEFEERLRIGKTGFLWDPRIVSLSFELEPLYRHGRQELGGESGRTRGSDLNYRIDVDVLNGAQVPFGGHFSAYQSATVNDWDLGGRTDSDQSHVGIGFRWRNDWLPLSLSVSETDLREVYEQVGLAPRARRDEKRRQYLISARNSKTSLSFDRLDLEDRVSNGERSYEWDRGRAWHLFRWGRNSSLRSSLDYNERRGFSPFRSWSVDESAEIQHTERLRSSTSLRYFSQEAATSDDLAEGRFNLHHRLYRNLDTHAYFRGRRRTTSLTDETTMIGGGSVQYRKRFFDRIDVGLGLLGEQGRTDLEAEAGGGEVVNEPHRASLQDPILLDQRFVDPVSVQVASAADGFVYTDGLDYEVVQFASQFTQVRIIPTGQITLGEQLLISYRYFVTPSVSYDQGTRGYNFSLGMGAWHFHHDDTRYVYDWRSGALVSVPPDQRYRNTSLGYSRRFGRWRLNLSASWLLRETGRFDTESLNLVQSLGIELSPRLSMEFTGSQVFSESKERIPLGLLMPDRSSRFDYFAAEGALNWRPRPSILIRPRLGYWYRKEDYMNGQSAPFDRRVLSMGLDARMQLRQLVFNLRLIKNDSDMNGVGTAEDRIMMTVTRFIR